MAELPYTAQCPSCDAEIDLSQADMEMAGGDIICGNCDHRFHAPDYLLKGFYNPDQPSPAYIEVDPATDAPPAPVAPQAPYQAQAPAPRRAQAEAAFEGQAQDAYQDPFAGPAEPSPTSPAYQQAAPATGAGNLNNAMQSEFDIMARYRRHKNRRIFGKLFNTALIALLLGAFLFQLAMVNFASWATQENFRPFYAFVCASKTFNCRLPVFYEPNKILVENTRATYQDGTVYLLEASLTNYNTASRKFPWLKVTVSDPRGIIRAQGRFSSNQYLPQGESPATTMPPAQQFPVAMKIILPPNTTQQGAPENNLARYEIKPLATD